MENGLLSKIGIDPAYLFILLFLIQVLLLIMLISVNLKYNRLKTIYLSFMRGKNGKNLEESILEKFDEIDELSEEIKKHKLNIEQLYEKAKKCYQKIGIVKYDAFQEMGGNLSFALAMLSEENNGWIINAMHSREGCYTYVKEIVNGQSYIELAEEEKECLDKAIFQETYDIKDMNIELK